MTVEKLKQKIEATLHIHGGEVVANAEHDDMYAAIDLLTDKLDRQLLKHKESSKASSKVRPLANAHLMIRIENILTPGRSLVNVPGGSKKRVLKKLPT